jgi:AbiV family abortive infection protein
MVSKYNIQIRTDILTDFRKAVFQNAKRLLFEAEALFNNGSFPTSAFLSITSIEEMGKFYLSRVFAIKNDQNTLTQKDLDTLTHHPPKQLNSFLPPFPLEKERKISPNIARFWGLVADKKLMPVRNNCLYVGFDRSISSIFIPPDNISRDDAFYFLMTAFEVILLQITSLLKSLDCSHEFLFLREEVKILNEKLQELSDKEIT